MKYIPLTQGKVAIVDDLDFKKLNRFKWYFEKSGYAGRDFKGKTIRMHQFIMNTPKKLHTDHINGDGLDNRRDNLRLATVAENTRNQKIRKDNTSGYKGVSFNKNRQKWQSYINYKCKMIHLGFFTFPEYAALKYNFEAKKLFGEFALLNKI